MCRVRYFLVSTKTWHSAAFPSHAYLAEMAHCTGCHSPMPRVVLFFHRVNTGCGGKMKIRALVLSLAIVALSMCSARAQVSIPILNPKFDMDVLTGPVYGSQAGITGWIAGPYSGVLRASTAQYPTAPATGLYCAYLGGPTSSGSILQTLGATVQANTTYVLKMSVGARADYIFTGYTAWLLAGNVVLASGHKSTPVGGTFVSEVVVYESGAAPD